MHQSLGGFYNSEWYEPRRRIYWGSLQIKNQQGGWGSWTLSISCWEYQRLLNLRETKTFVYYLVHCLFSYTNSYLHLRLLFFFSMKEFPGFEDSLVFMYIIIFFSAFEMCSLWLLNALVCFLNISCSCSLLNIPNSGFIIFSNFGKFQVTLYSD